MSGSNSMQNMFSMPVKFRYLNSNRFFLFFCLLSTHILGENSFEQKKLHDLCISAILFFVLPQFMVAL